MELQLFSAERHTDAQSGWRAEAWRWAYLLRSVYLYTRRYFPSRPLSESETSKQQDTGIPLLCLFTSPAGGAHDRRAARACTSVTCNKERTLWSGVGVGVGVCSINIAAFQHLWHRDGAKPKHLKERHGRNRPFDIPACFIASQPASVWMFMGTLSCGTWWESQFPLI